MSILLLFNILLLQAQQQVFYELLTENDGLSDNRVTCFLKDKTGYLWVGTRNGLNRYDSHDFTVFQPTKKGISNELINEIEQDENGHIWVATMNGLNRFDPVTKNWQSFFASGADSAHALLNPIVWDCYVDGGKQVWLATDRQGISVYDIEKKVFRHYPWKSYVVSVLPQLKNRYFSVIKIVTKNEDEFWLGTTIGLFSFNKKTGNFNLIGSGYNSYNVELVYSKKQGKVYLTTSDKNVFCYDERTGQYAELQKQAISYPSTAFSIPQDDYVWLAYSDGLLLADPHSKKVYEQQHIPQLSFSLPEGGIKSIYHDATGISWLASDNGIVKYDRNNQLALFLPLLPITDRISDNPMGGMYYDAKSESYFVCGTETAIVFIVNRRTGIIRKIVKDASGKPFSTCNSIRADRSGTIWLMTLDAVYRYNHNTGSFENFPMPRKAAEGFRDVILDTEGNYWFSCFYGRLYYYHTSSKKFMIPGDSAMFKGVLKSTSLYMDTLNSNIWIGTFSHGTYKYHLPTKKFTLYTEEKISPNYTPLNLVHDITQDKLGNMWVATHSGGLFKYEEGKPYEKAFTQISMQEGLISNNIYSVAAIDSILWILSGKQVSTYNIYTGKVSKPVVGKQIFPFTTFSSAEYLPHHFSYDKVNKELMVAVGGGVMFLKQKAAIKKDSFPVLLSSVIINGKEVNDSVISSGQMNRISSPLKDLAIEFSALHYSLSSLTQYEFMLEGQEDEWRQAININKVNYQNLPAGDYRFRLRAKTHNGVASVNEVAFNFTVAPFFWNTWWFRLLVVLAVSGIVYSWVKGLRRKIWAEKKLNYFATSLYGQNSPEEIFRDIARNCVTQLNAESCLLFQYDEASVQLIQKASVLKNTGGERANNKNEEGAYLSQLRVPLEVDDKKFAVIDARHSKKGFFKKYHLQLLEKIAAVAATKISKYMVEEKLRSKIARDLHDEMGSTLTSINIISKVAMQQSGDDEKISQHLEKIKDNSSRMMESMSDMVWAINPSNDTFEKVALRMKEFAAELLEPAGINYFFREEGQMEKAVLNPEQRKDIYLIFKEALNNAVKYSSASEIDILLKKENGFVIMKVMDNGKGFDKANYKSGNGIKNIQIRGLEMKAMVTIDSIPGTGTTISIQVPVT